MLLHHTDWLKFLSSLGAFQRLPAETRHFFIDEITPSQAFTNGQLGPH